MKILPISYKFNNYNVKKDETSLVNSPVSNPNFEISNHCYKPSFLGNTFERTIVRTVKGKVFQGLGLYKNGSDYIDFSKVGWEFLKNEPIDWLKAADNEIHAFRHSLALAENNDTTWVRRYNNRNVTKPLAVFHSLSSKEAKQKFAEHLRELFDFKRHRTLDVPITDKNGKLCFDCTVFDTETTGLNLFRTETNPELDKIIQIGAIQVKQGKVINSTAMSQLINPEMPIPEAASRVHGLTDEMVKNQPVMEKVLKPFLNNYLNKKNGVIVAYNSKFDITMLNNAIREHNGFSHDLLKERRTCKVLDPFLLIQRIHPYLGARKKLGEQYKFLFCKNLEGAHDAFADVKGTVDVLKYTLYFLSEHRIDKTKPLTLREVLIFQNGGKLKNLDINLDNEGCNSAVNFKQSYRHVVIPADNYFKGYKLKSDTLDEIRQEIGEDNYKRLNGEVVNALIDLNPKDSHSINPRESFPASEDQGVVNASYVMKSNFKKLLDLEGISAYNGKTKEEMIDFITEKAKHYVKEEIVEIWMKNPNPKDIPDGNDLPDINIARKVMTEKNI